jgi:hypothetical protein
MVQSHPLCRLSYSPNGQAGVNGAHGRTRTPILSSLYGSPLRRRRRLRAHVWQGQQATIPHHDLERVVSCPVRRCPHGSDPRNRTGRPRHLLERPAGDDPASARWRRAALPIELQPHGGKWRELNPLPGGTAFTAQRRHQPALIGTSRVGSRPGVAPGSTRLMRPHGSLTDLPASELVSAGRFERPLSALSTRSLCRLGYADEMEDQPGHDPGTCGLRDRRSAH